MKKMTFTILAFMIVLTQIVYAHPPSSFKTGYNPMHNELLVVVMHPVGDPETHYVSKIRILLNGDEVAKKEFGDQIDETYQETTFTLPPIKPEDDIVIEAYCNVSGSLKEKVNFNKPAASEKPLKDGVYVAKNAMMDIAVTVKDKRITKIEILENRVGGQRYLEMIQPLIDRVIAEQTTKVDAVTGASVSSNILKQLIDEAIQQAR